MKEIFQTFIKASKEEIIDAAAKPREKTPAIMNFMLEEVYRVGNKKEGREKSNGGKRCPSNHTRYFLTVLHWWSKLFILSA